MDTLASLCSNPSLEYNVRKHTMKNIRRMLSLPDDASFDEMSSPVGTLTIITSPEGLHTILWDNDRDADCEEIMFSFKQCKDEKTSVETKKQLNEYFQGKRKTFDLPLVITGTPFQTQVWKQLLKIPYATTISYAEQAEGIGNRNKARIVGVTNGLNPIPIIIPCHRVIGSNGHLVGFGGGLDKKTYLLALEQRGAMHE